MPSPLPMTVLLCTLALAACGTRGPLTLPPPQIAPPAAAKAPANAAATTPAGNDLNTAKEAPR